MVVPSEMPIYDHNMDISVTLFRSRCLELIRRVEVGGAHRHQAPGQSRRSSSPPAGGRGATRRPWERLRGTGELRAEPDESVLDAGEFEASR